MRWRWWTSKPDTPTLKELQADADRIYALVRAGGSCTPPGTGIHRQLVDDMGGTEWWEALQNDLDQAVNW